MHTPNPSAHACTTLPPGDLPMRCLFPEDWHGAMYLESANREIARCARPQFKERPLFAPIGCWSVSETRTDSDGHRWIKHDFGEPYFVVDNYGDLVEVARKGGAA